MYIYIHICMCDIRVYIIHMMCGEGGSTHLNMHHIRTDPFGDPDLSRVYPPTAYRLLHQKIGANPTTAISVPTPSEPFAKSRSGTYTRT